MAISGVGLYGIDRARFITKLQKHLNDFYKGKEYLSKDTARELKVKSYQSATSLASNFPKSSADYNGLVSALTYDNKARLVTAISATTQDVAIIKKAHESYDELHSKILKKFNK